MRLGVVFCVDLLFDLIVGCGKSFGVMFVFLMSFVLSVVELVGRCVGGDDLNGDIFLLDIVFLFNVFLS